MKIKEKTSKYEKQMYSIYFYGLFILKVQKKSEGEVLFRLKQEM
jgi:hypothetical protein